MFFNVDGGRSKISDSTCQGPCRRCFLAPLVGVDVFYAAPQAYRIVNVALHQEYSPGIIFIFSQWRKDLYHV
jgi:hypothetical protein